MVRSHEIHKFFFIRILYFGLRLGILIKDWTLRLRLFLEYSYFCHYIVEFYCYLVEFFNFSLRVCLEYSYFLRNLSLIFLRCVYTHDFSYDLVVAISFVLEVVATSCKELVEIDSKRQVVATF